MPATRRLILIIIILLLLILFLVVPSVSWSQTPPPNPWRDPARELAKRIVGVIGRQDALSLAYENRSSLSHTEVILIRKTIEQELAKNGVATTDGIGTAGATVTFSENPQILVWVARVIWNDSQKTIFLELPRPQSISSPASSGVNLRSELFWEQSAPILDVVDFRISPVEEPLLAVLEPRQIQILEYRASGWNLRESFPLPRTALVGRDPRGSVDWRPEEVFARFSGETCTLNFTLSKRVLCEGERNQALAPPGQRASPKLESAYSGVLFELEGKQVWLFAASDGIARLAEQQAPTSILASFTGWGSQLTALQTNCRSGMQALVTRPTDWTEPDAILAFEFEELEAVPISSPLIVSGPVLKLHAAVSDQSAWAVVRNLRTDRYEIHSITLSCGR